MLLSRTHSGGAGSEKTAEDVISVPSPFVLAPAGCSSLTTSNRRSLVITTRSPIVCLTPCGTGWRSLSSLVASHPIYILYRPRILHCAPRRYPTVEPGHLQLPRHYALGLLQ